VTRTPFVRRVAAIVLVLMLAPLTYGGVACAAWSGSGADRHACPEAAAMNCASFSVDSCCADGEQRRNVETVTAMVVTPGEVVSEAVPAVPVLPRSFVADPCSLAERPHTYLLDSVFLI
jgi:hypothetical protein